MSYPDLSNFVNNNSEVISQQYQQEEPESTWFARRIQVLRKENQFCECEEIVEKVAIYASLAFLTISVIGNLISIPLIIYGKIEWDRQENAKLEKIESDARQQVQEQKVQEEERIAKQKEQEKIAARQKEQEKIAARQKEQEEIASRQKEQDEEREAKQKAEAERIEKQRAAEKESRLKNLQTQQQNIAGPTQQPPRRILPPLQCVEEIYEPPQQQPEPPRSNIQNQQDQKTKRMEEIAKRFDECEAMLKAHRQQQNASQVRDNSINLPKQQNQPEPAGQKIVKNELNDQGINKGWIPPAQRSSIVALGLKRHTSTAKFEGKTQFSTVSSWINEIIRDYGLNKENPINKEKNGAALPEWQNPDWMLALADVANDGLFAKYKDASDVQKAQAAFDTFTADGKMSLLDASDCGYWDTKSLFIFATNTAHKYIEALKK